MTKQCKVAVFEKASEPLQVKLHPIPQLQSREILVKVEACTICGSDLHTVSGKRKEKTPTILGHEIIGTVAELGSAEIQDVDGGVLSVGDRLTWSVCISCGGCERCQNGVPQKCLTLKKIGHEQLQLETGLLGGFSEYVLLPENASTYKLPAEINVRTICPANCATATVIAAFRKVPRVEGKSALVVGAGLLGLTACSYARVNGAEKVTAVDPDKTRREVARKFGADETLANFPDDDHQKDEFKFDLIMDFSGSSSAIEQAIRCSQISAHAVLVGSVSPSPPCRLDPEFLVRNLVSVHGVHNYAPEDLKDAITFLCENGQQFPFHELVAKSFPLEKINDAIDFARKQKPIRVMIQP